MTRFDDWQILVLILIGFFVTYLVCVLRLMQEMSRLEGRVDSLKEDYRLVREEMDSVRVRLREVERRESSNDNNSSKEEQNNAGRID
jgi:uncharacterized membrane protein (DUF106 family)